MKNHVLIANLVLVGLATCWLSAGETPDRAASSQPSDTDPDMVAIRQAAADFAKAFDRGDAKGVAAHWTEDGEYIDENGQAYRGRAVIQKEYETFFAQNPGTKIELTVDAIRRLSADTAIEDGRAVAAPAPAGAPGISKYTAVHVKVDGKWLMASVRDTWIEAPAAISSAADLEWLVGTWVAEEHGVKTESVCRWVVDGRFLERSSTTTQVDGTKSAGVQLIGWNPEGGHVQSWNFSPDGGHAVGVWISQQGGWTSLMRGTTGDGTLTTSINHLRRLDDNAYVWQSVQRSAGGLALPDTDEVVWKRQPAGR